MQNCAALMPSKQPDHQLVRVIGDHNPLDSLNAGSVGGLHFAGTRWVDRHSTV